ncbi:MAG: transglutaminase family protein [Alphaproteobacteria bacterium]|nr:MAG: transglutaminase family protein [Alphaproteobacteria bacterium]
MRLTISHDTKYQFAEPPRSALQQARLTPKSGPGQTVLEWRVSIDGGIHEVTFTDHHDNVVDLFTLKPGHAEFTVRSEGVVETAPTSGITGPHGGLPPLWYFNLSTPLTSPGPHIRRLVAEHGPGDEGEIARLHALSRGIAKAVRYTPNRTNTNTTAEDALASGHGVCQDHAHVFCAAARMMGFPARYISGYLMMEGQAAQAASHAWADVHVEAIGWVGFDISNAQSPDDRYVRVATGLDYREAAPLSGTRTGGGEESMMVTIQVQQ